MASGAPSFSSMAWSHGLDGGNRCDSSLLKCYIWTSLHYADTSDCLVYFLLFPSSKPMYDMIWLGSRVQYDLAWFSCTIRSGCVPMYNINLRATHTTILSIGGVTIPIYLVSSTTDSIRRCVVLFKPVPVLASDLKSEFLCQLSYTCAEPTDSPEPPHMPGISPTPLSPRITRTVIVRVLSLST